MPSPLISLCFATECSISSRRRVRSRTRVQEDDVLEWTAKHLREVGFRVLALGGNQAGFFRFTTRGGRTKAPDLVAWRYPNLLVSEAKVRAGDLFGGPRHGECDAECIRYAVENAEQREKLAREAQRVLRVIGIQMPTAEIRVIGGLVAATAFPKELPPSTHGLLLLRASVDQLVQVAAGGAGDLGLERREKPAGTRSV
jgi:hypothetical protein